MHSEMAIQVISCVGFLHAFVFLTYGLTCAQYIYVYSEYYQQGKHLEVCISNCSNLPDSMTGQVTSINTQGFCARFYDKLDCKGHSIEVMPRSPSHHNLHDWGFNDRIMSVEPCRDPCHPEVTGPIPKEPLELFIFGHENYKGPYGVLTVAGCTLIPPQFTRQLLSVQTNGTCFQLYNNINCKSKGVEVDTIELRSGTPFHDNIRYWYFYEARAVSHCAYKCNGDTNQTTNNSLNVPQTLQSGEVLLFDRKKFSGNWVKLRVKNCFNLTTSWEGAADSILVGNQTCVILFDRRDCSGDSLRITKSQDLSVRNFDGITRSIQGCLHENGSSSNLHLSNQENGSLETTTSSMSTGILTVLIVLPVLGVLLSVFFLMKNCNRYNGISAKLTEKEIEDFLRGFELEISTDSNNASRGFSSELLAQNQPYNKTYEISLSNIKFDNKSPLGMGEFGVVYKGEVTRMKPAEDGSHQSPYVETISVAVKTVRPNSSVQCLRSLLKEVKIMLYVGKHAHIVDMVGCCTENLCKGEILVLMEFCSWGSIESFLQKHRAAFKNIVKKGRIDMSENTIASDHLSCTETEHQNFESNVTSYFDFFQLVRWCIEIAEGMEYLASTKVIHSDLAARNVLLDADFKAKISDFGLSRQLYCYTQYVKKRQDPLPWRWMAIESLKNLEFSTSSDVWGYGVLSWEIFTLGGKPYPGVVWNDNFLRNLEEGLRLPKPKYATNECYNVMIWCWDDEPTSRPNFSEILVELREITSTTSSQTLPRPPSNPIV